VYLCDSFASCPDSWFVFSQHDADGADDDGADDSKISWMNPSLGVASPSSPEH
jgi:hypothetical protein